MGALVAFLVVTLVAAWLMWNGSKVGAIVGLALLPLEAVFWIGFALPVPWVCSASPGSRWSHLPGSRSTGRPIGPGHRRPRNPR